MLWWWRRCRFWRGFLPSREVIPRLSHEDCLEEGVYSIGSCGRHLVDVSNSHCIVVPCMVLPIFSFFLFRYFWKIKSSLYYVFFFLLSDCFVSNTPDSWRIGRRQCYCRFEDDFCSGLHFKSWMNRAPHNLIQMPPVWRSCLLGSQKLENHRLEELLFISPHIWSYTKNCWDNHA